MLDGGTRKNSLKEKCRNGNPLITIVTVVYNGAMTLEETILSVLNQTYNNIEYIIIDGGSNDNTLEILKKYDEKIDYWISESDSGIYEAMNKGLNLSQGDWLLFLGSDDTLYTKTVISDIICFFSNKNTVYYGNVYFTKAKIIYNGKFSLNKLIAMNICHQSIFYPKFVYKYNQYSMRYKILSDYAYNLMIFRHIKFLFIDAIIANFNESGCSSKEDIIFKKDKSKIVIREFGLAAFLFSLCSLFYYRISFYFKKIIGIIINVICFVFF